MPVVLHPLRAIAAAVLLSCFMVYPSAAARLSGRMPAFPRGGSAFLTSAFLPSASLTPRLPEWGSRFTPDLFGSLNAVSSPMLLFPTPVACLNSWAPPELSWLWNPHADPSLHLSDWSRVLNVARRGVFVVPLRDDPAERTNILLAAQSVDNALVLPGGVFSFNDVVGERTEERGYQDGLMFNAGQIVRGTGGGICLIATALYNAALQAGLEIRERHSHSGIVSYAPPGCDASVVYGVEDMQFVNTTASPIRVKARIEPERVVVGLYGIPFPKGEYVLLNTTHLNWIPAPSVETPDPALLSTDAPLVVQKPHAGYDVTVERVWTKGSRVLRREVVAQERRDPRPQILHVPLLTGLEEKKNLPDTASDSGAGL